MLDQLNSTERDKLYTALAKAQAEFPIIRSNRKAFKNEYADLYAILRHTYPVLRKYGLSIKPWAGEINGEQWIGARLSHESGQWETNVYKLEVDVCKNPNDQITHKKQGALTYFNRNHIKDMLGVLLSDNPEDDDAQYHEPVELITKEQLQDLIKLINNRKDTEENIKKYFNISNLSYIPKDAYTMVKEKITTK